MKKQTNQKYSTSSTEAPLEVLIQNLTNSNNLTKEVMSRGNTLESLLKVEEDVNAIIAKGIVLPPPLLSHNSTGIIFKGAINVIQGKTGTHKSRLLGIFLTTILKGRNNIGLSNSKLEDIEVVYIDTERAVASELALGVKDILLNLSATDKTKFHFTSIKHIQRKDRLKLLMEYLTNFRKKSTGHIVIGIDVITDCICDPNNFEESLLFIDEMNNILEQFDATVIAVIHENPMNQKARGHVGTEIGNKSSSLISIGFQYKSTEIMKIEFKKIRSDKKAESILCKYDDTVGNLRTLTLKDSQSFLNTNVAKAKVEEVVYALLGIMNVDDVIDQGKLIDKLSLEVEITKNTIKKRLDVIIEDEIVIIEDDEGNAYSLQKKVASGTKTTYFLQKKLVLPASSIFNTNLAYD
jgi:hypothetical protein